ncbi:hypothetical protein NIES2100_72280 [Calothrix sp. NIES-2100]|uniref:DUF6745 domain-containing protein n=1 Tax=Calothrix sp. NIES-2100 TaxID=1954172 RepID=UPI000B5F0944|nr:hypothetical protein NIES2100_72280 [Calothrix sp. NIES-2100]
MSNQRIAKLTPEQAALIPVYREKWTSIALSTIPIDRQKARESVTVAYQLLDLPEPEIIFFDSPYAAWNERLVEIINLPKKERWQIINEIELITGNLKIHLINELRYQLTPQIQDELLFYLHRELDIEPLLSNELNLMWSILDSKSNRKLQTSEITLAASGVCNLWAEAGAYLDFCISVLNCVVDQQRWIIYQNLITNMGKLFPMKKQAVLCDRPCKLLFDNENRLHSEAEAAVQYVDGYSVYVERGTRITSKQFEKRMRHMYP